MFKQVTIDKNSDEHEGDDDNEVENEETQSLHNDQASVMSIVQPVYIESQENSINNTDDVNIQQEYEVEQISERRSTSNEDLHWTVKATIYIAMFFKVWFIVFNVQ